MYGYLHTNTSTATTTADAGANPDEDKSPQPDVPVRVPRTCPTCGYEPATRAEAAHQRGDLAVAWLHPNAADPNTVVTRSHCRRCAPESPAFDIACAVCGDGPILAGAFAHTATVESLPIPVQQWLTDSRWTWSPTLLCPDHRHEST